MGKVRIRLADAIEALIRNKDSLKGYGVKLCQLQHGTSVPGNIHNADGRKTSYTEAMRTKINHNRSLPKTVETFDIEGFRKYLNSPFGPQKEMKILFHYRKALGELAEKIESETVLTVYDFSTRIKIDEEKGSEAMNALEKISYTAKK